MAGCRGVPYGQRTNGSNTSVGGWVCRTVRLTTQAMTGGIVIFHCPLEQRDVYFGIRLIDNKRLLAHVAMTLPRGCARPRPGYAPAIASCSFA